VRILTIIILLFALPGISNAQGSRSKTWEGSIAAIYQDSKFISGEGGSSVDIDSQLGFGLNFAYNLTSKFALGADFEFIRPDYTAVLVEENTAQPPIRIDHEMYQFNGRLKGILNILDGPFTPYVEAGIGWTYVDSKVADGPPTTGCWWHPWYGYICNNYYDTFDDTVFSYGGALGLRYELRGGSMLKLSYNHWELDGAGSASDAGFNAARLEFGWSF